MFIYSENVRFVRYPKIKRTILLNRANGFWIKIPDSWANVLDEFLKASINLELFLKRFEDVGNAKTFEDLVHTLIKYSMVVEAEHREEEELQKVQVALTERCNLFCKHCCYDATQADKKSDLELQETCRILDKVIACGPKSITLSGGEPLIRKDFFEILKYVKKHYVGEITLSTNATLMKESDIPTLAKNITSFDISLDGYDETTCERIRGKGVFNKVIKNIKILQECGANNINLSMVDVNHSKNAREKFKELNRQLGTRSVIRALAPIGRAATMESKREYLDTLYTPRELSATERREICAGFRGTKCGAYRNQFFVDYNGDIYPCGLLINEKYKIGNLLKMDDNDVFPFVDATKNSLYNLGNLEPDKMDTCKECEINFFCWGCLQEADMLDGDPLLIKRRCELKHEHLSHIIWGGSD